MLKYAVKTVIAMAALVSVGSLHQAAAQDIRRPRLDADGKFYIYKDLAPGAPMPFVPYAYMPAEAGEMMKIDVASKDDPYIPEGASAGKAAATCISVKINWKSPNWVGCAFVSGPDSPAWWGEDDRGWYYDLSGLKKKKLVFFARAKGGSEVRIQVKVGILGDKKFGDSMSMPAETRWLKLSPKWTRYECDISGYTAKQLSKVCNGLTFVTNQDQNGGATETEFALDEIYFE